MKNHNTANIFPYIDEYKKKEYITSIQQIQIHDCIVYYTLKHGIFNGIEQLAEYSVFPG